MGRSISTLLSAALLLPLLPVTGLPGVPENLKQARDHVQNCNPNNCLRAYQNIANFHAATSFCAAFIPPGTYTTVTTTYTQTVTFGQFSPSITAEYTKTDAFSYLRTLAPLTEFPFMPPASTPTSLSIPPATPTTTLYPPFMHACSDDAEKISSACSCVVPSVTTVLAIVALQIEDVFPYTGPIFRR